MIKFNLLGILSPAKDNFVSVETMLNGNPITNGQWKLYDDSYQPGMQTISHNLGFKPLDVLVLHESGGTVAFHYASFTDKKIIFTVSTSETRLRFLVGKAN